MSLQSRESGRWLVPYRGCSSVRPHHYNFWNPTRMEARNDIKEANRNNDKTRTTETTPIDGEASMDAVPKPRHAYHDFPLE